MQDHGKLADLATPCLVLNRARLVANISRMRTRARDLGVALRPHMKTAKSIHVAQMIAQDGPLAITVSTRAEIAYFHRHGVRDMIWAVGADQEKARYIAEAQRDGGRITAIVDSVEAAHAVAGAAPAASPIHVLIELDCGAHRGGVAPEASLVLEIARILQDASGTRLEGVLTHAGHSYAQHSRAAIEEIAEQERRCAVDAAARIRAAGYPCPVVSVGATPTALFARHLEGVTEIRPGVFAFFDRFQAGLECCTDDDMALTVLATVIGRRPDLGYALIDAGALALSQDTSTRRWDGVPNYGAVYDSEGRERLGDLVVADVHQEHGFLRSLGARADVALPEIGARVRIAPNHACMTAAGHDRYYVTEGGDDVVSVWPKCSGWETRRAEA